MEKGAALPKNIRQIGEISGREKICMEDYVMTWIRKRESQEDKGYLGIFLGEQQEADDSVYVFIRGVLEIPAELQEQKAQETIRQEREKYFGDWTVQGCCVIGTYPTERMKTLASWIPESGKLIYHLQEQEETLYWTGEEQYRRLHGYFVFYEQNQRMQEYLTQIFGEESVEKESTPDRAIRSFREKVKEKGEQKRGNFLRMASSFFVITVLVIGAIVVNRIEDIRAIRNRSLTASQIAAERQQEEGEDVQTSAVSGNRTWQAADEAVQYNAIQKAAEEGDLKGSDAFWEESGYEDSSERQPEETDSADAVAQGGAASDIPGDADTAAQDGAASEVSGSADTVSQNGAASEVSGSADTVSQNEAVSEVSGSADIAIQNGVVSEASGSADITGQGGAASEVSGSADTVSQNGAASEVSGSADTAVQDGAASGTLDSAGNRSDEDSPTSEENDAQEAVAIRHMQAGYVVKEGDTLAKICSRYYGTMDRIEEVCKANGIKDANMILPGQRIVLP